MVTDPQTNKPTHKHTQTVPITIHCAAKLNAQCKYKPANGQMPAKNTAYNYA